MITPSLPPNAHVIFHSYPEEKDEYLGEIAKQGGPWDVVVIDSAWREESGRRAIENLTSRGIIVWDNSRLPAFADFMRDTFAPAGFKELPFRRARTDRPFLRPHFDPLPSREPAGHLARR